MINNKKYNVGIVGGTGYTGIELCRILAIHPHCTVTHVFSKASAGKSVKDIYPHLSSIKELVYAPFNPEVIPSSIDVLFLALPHVQTHAYMPVLLETARKHNIKVIDLSADFRLKEPGQFNQYYDALHKSPELLEEIPYGLPEKNRDLIQATDVVATPGCYATAVILGLMPLAKSGKISDQVIIDAKSGVSGAGKGMKQNLMYCQVNESFSNYATGTHRHTVEIQEETGATVLFSPHLVPMSRGILATMYVKNTEGLTQEEVDTLYESVVKGESFLDYKSQVTLSTSQVSGSNQCILSSYVKGEYIIVISVIDNLVKGASGQAVQCMNIMMDWKEDLGLNQLVPFYT